MFKNNTEITSFDELRFFTGLSVVAFNAFSESTLERITYPNVISGLAIWVRNNATITSVKVNRVSGTVSLGDQSRRSTYKLIYIGECEALHGYFFRDVEIEKLYLGNTIPPSYTPGYGSNINNVTEFYVPIGCAETYQTWASRTNGYLEYDFELDPDGVKPPEL